MALGVPPRGAKLKPGRVDSSTGAERTPATAENATMSEEKATILNISMLEILDDNS